MALQTIRYGGGVWKQHEELRLRLEAKVSTYEQQLAVQQQTLVDAQEANEKLQSELDVSQNHTSELQELVQKLSQESETLRVALGDANQRQADTKRSKHQLQSQVDALNSLCTRQKELLDEHTSRIARLELQVDTSRDEELRLCDLLYEAQEKNEDHEMELTKLQRELRIVTRASQVKTKQMDALTKEKAVLVQKLAQLRGANPKVHFAPSATVKKSNNREKEITVMPQQPTASTKSNQQDEELRNAAPAVIDDKCGGCCCASTTGSESPSPSAGLLWRELQLMSAKVRSEQRKNARLHERIGTLEYSERALTVRFREAAAARQRAERNTTRRAL